MNNRLELRKKLGSKIEPRLTIYLPDLWQENELFEGKLPVIARLRRHALPGERPFVIITVITSSAIIRIDNEIHSQSEAYEYVRYLYEKGYIGVAERIHLNGEIVRSKLVRWIGPQGSTHFMVRRIKQVFAELPNFSEN